MTVPSEVGSFVSVWLRSRPSHLVRRAAAVAVLLTFIAIPAFQDTPKGSLMARYRNAGFAALRENEPEKAELYFKRMGRLDSTDMEGRFGMAMTAEKLNNLPLAYRLMTGLAHGDTTYPLAHHWLAEKILEDRGDDLSEDDFWQVQRHLEEAVAEPTAFVKAHALLGSLLMSRGEHHEAIPHLAAVVDSRPELRIALARAYAATGSQEDAGQEVERALGHFRSMSLASPGNADCCLIRVQCEIMSGHKVTAVRVLKRARNRFPEDGRFREVLEDMHFAEADSALRAEDFETALQHLDEVMRLNPEATGILERFAVVAGSKANVNDMALEKLKSVAAAGKAPAAAHLAIGGVLLQRRDTAGAIYHFEIGLRHNPDSVALLNNLAWCLSREDPKGNKRALRLIERALERAEVNSKTRAEVRETHGQILARMGRFSEAAVSLESALPKLTDRSDAHATLAQIYDQLGQSSMAGLHRKSRISTMARNPNSRTSRQ
ncbi:MAG: tetratricopeptide repeat protein [Planctomycetaceae bacterium]